MLAFLDGARIESVETNLDRPGNGVTYFSYNAGEKTLGMFLVSIWATTGNLLNS